MHNLPFRALLARMNTSLKSLLSSVVLLASSSALADSATTIPAFDAKIATARGASSPGGTTVTRTEMRGAVDLFLQDDSAVDAAERAHMGAKLGSAAFLTGVNGSAKKYLSDTYELNDTAAAAPLGNFAVAQTPAELFGVSGSLAYSSVIREGYIPSGQGVANQLTLVETFNANVGFSDKAVSYFTPITTQELIAQLSTQYYSTRATVDEVEGALAYIYAIYRNSNRLYISGWTSTYNGGPGYAQGFVVAAVSSDRRFVRFVDVLTYGE